MNEDDYMKEFRDKAAEVTQELNRINNGDGSSAIYNLNMHQDFIINKLGLKKKLAGHDLIIKILLFKILGLKTNDEEMKKQIDNPEEKPKSAMSVRFMRTNHNMSAVSENRSSLKNYIRNYSRASNKPNTHQGSRFSSNFFKNYKLGAASQASKELLNQNKKHTCSLDMTSNK